jgi:HPr kinase/phosphorylase
MAEENLNVHATCVAFAGRGVLIIGPSGSGKSALAIQLIALGAVLVSDDRTLLKSLHGSLIASPAAAIAGLIEARSVGILRLRHLAEATVSVCVDMSLSEQERLPQPHSLEFLDIMLPCLRRVDAHYFPAAVHAYLTGKLIET